MAYLGTPFEISYLAKGFRTGLTNVVAYVRKPDTTVVGPLTLVEGTGVFVGQYFTSFISQLSDPQGEYFATILSPTESNKDSLRISLVTDQTATFAELLEELGEDITTIGTEVTALTTQVTALEESVATLVEEIASFGGFLTTLQRLVNTLISSLIPVFIRGGVRSVLELKGFVSDPVVLRGKTSALLQVRGFVFDSSTTQGETRDTLRLSNKVMDELKIVGHIEEQLP